MNEILNKISGIIKSYQNKYKGNLKTQTING
jgi:hypothetical protein